MRTLINFISWGSFLVLMNHMTETRSIGKEPVYQSDSNLLQIAHKKLDQSNRGVF
jgi:hypothetical protein